MEKLRHTFSVTSIKAKDCHLYILTVSLTLLLVLIVYWRDLEILINEALNTEALTHVILVPFFIGFLSYQKRDLFKASIALNRVKRQSKTQCIDALVGLSLCLIAFLIYWYGSYTFYPLEYHILSLPIFVMGAVLILFGLKILKVLIIPILFLFFLIPIPSEIMYTIGGNLANFNTQAAYTLLKPLGLPVTLSTAYGAPTILLTTSAGQSTSFTIDLPCSGIYTFIAFTMFATFLVLIISASMLRKILIFILGFAVFEILNVIRITTIISAAYFLGEVAILVFHMAAGLILTFIGMLITLFVSDKLLKVQFSPKINEMPSCPKCKTIINFENFCINCGKFFNPLRWKPSRTFWAKLIILLLGCSALAFSVNAPVFAIARGPQGPIEVKSTWENSTSIFPQVPQYGLIFLYRDVNYERIAKQDASLAYAYFPTNASEPVVYVIVGVANSISNLHSWEVCLISWQTAQGQYPLVTVLDSKDIELLESVPIIARYLVFKNQDNYTQVTLYWYERVAFGIGITVQQKYVRISLIILTKNYTNYQQYENKLLEFGKAIASYWEPIKTQSLISLGIPAQQTLLVLLVALIIIAKITQYTSEWQKRTNNLKIFNSFASPEDKLLLQTITKLNKEKKGTVAIEINSAIKKEVGKSMKFEKLVERLNRIQEYGFVKIDLISNNNRPLLVWKSLVNI